MSLRDQLLKAGLVSKRDARRADHEKRKALKQVEGSLDKKAKREAERARARAEAEAKAVEERRERRRAEQEVRDLHERALRIRQLIRAHEIRGRGPVRYFHRELRGTRILEIPVSAGLAKSLQAGGAAIAAEDMGNRIRYVVVSDAGAERLRGIAPEVLVDPAVVEAAGRVDRDWLPDLRARRATPEDIARLVATAKR